VRQSVCRSTCGRGELLDNSHKFSLWCSFSLVALSYSLVKMEITLKSRTARTSMPAVLLVIVACIAAIQLKTSPFVQQSHFSESELHFAVTDREVDASPLEAPAVPVSTISQATKRGEDEIQIKSPRFRISPASWFAVAALSFVMLLVHEDYMAFQASQRQDSTTVVVKNVRGDTAEERKSCSNRCGACAKCLGWSDDQPVSDHDSRRVSDVVRPKTRTSKPKDDGKRKKKSSGAKNKWLSFDDRVLMCAKFVFEGYPEDGELAED